MDKSTLKKALRAGNLLVRSMDRTTKKVAWNPIKDIMRHSSYGKNILKVSCDETSIVVTEDHSLFDMQGKDIRSSDVKIGDRILISQQGNIESLLVTGIEKQENRQYMYDISVPEDENFVLDSGVIAHNSYSVSGVSLDIEKSSKYQAIKDEFISEYDKLVDLNKQSIKIIKGLRQFRYGIGIQSALGPLSRPGVQSRRNWVSPDRSTWI